MLDIVCVERHQDHNSLLLANTDVVLGYDSPDTEGTMDIAHSQGSAIPGERNSVAPAIPCYDGLTPEWEQIIRCSLSTSVVEMIQSTRIILIGLFIL